MDELLQTALRHLRGMWHRRWIGLAVAWIAAIVGMAVVFRIPEKYEASARVYVDTQSLLRPLMQGLAIQPNLDQQVALMSRTLISRPNVEKLVRMADLDLRVKSNAEREEMIDNLMKSLQLGGNVSTNIYLITYRDANADQAKNVVQSLLTIFMESSLGDKRQDSRAAVRFLDDQIKHYEETLQAAESRLKEFKLKYMGVAGQGGPDFFGRLSKLRDDIESARLELRSAEESRDSYKRELAGEVPNLLTDNRPVTSVTLQDIDKRITTQKTKLDELLRTYTEQHPDVVGIRRVIEELGEQRKQEVAALEKAVAAAPQASRGSTDRNPVYEQMRVSLSDAEANVASLKARLSSYEAQYGQLRSSARLVPQVEAEFAQLNRDYDVQKKTYGDLLARREAAAMGVDVQDTGGTQFRVIDPPRVAPQPVAPTRMVLLMMVLLGALGAGFAASFVANEVMPIFQDARALRDSVQRPILGMVSILPSEATVKLKRRNAFLFAGGLGGLIAWFSAFFVVVLLAARVA